MTNPYKLDLQTIDPDIFSFRGGRLKDLENDNKQSIDFKKEYQNLNYRYGLSQRSERSEYRDERIKYLENQMNELNDIMYHTIGKKDEYIDNMVKENQMLKEKIKTTGKATEVKLGSTTKIPRLTKKPEVSKETLKEQIIQLEAQILHLNNHVYINTALQNDDEYIIAQIDMWKNKSEYLMNLYPNTIADMKRQIFSQNLEFKTNIEATKENNNQILYNLDGAYRSLLDQTEYDIEELLKEREYLESKTKEIKKVLRINK
jgi:hypothetical protein